MACNCFSDVKERMVARVKEVLGDSVHSMEECDFGSRVWVLEKGDYCAVMLPFNVRYHKRKKNGEPEQRITNASLTLTQRSQSITAHSAVPNSTVKPSQMRKLPHEIHFYGDG